MKRPKRRLGNRAKALLASLLLLSAGCFRAGVKCPENPFTAPAGIKPAFLPRKPVREHISVTWRKSVLMVNAEGELFFLPPDTLRMEIRSEWGETLFDLRMAGKDVSFRPESKSADAGLIQGVFRGFSKEAILDFLAGRPGLSSLAGLVPADSLKWGCTGDEVFALGGGCRLALDREGRYVRRIEFANLGWAYEIQAVEAWQGEELPSRFRLRSDAAGTVDIAISGRAVGGPVSGSSILK